MKPSTIRMDSTDLYRSIKPIKLPLRPLSRLHKFFPSLLTAVAIVFIPLKFAQAAEIRIGGTGAGIGTMTKLAEAFHQSHPNVRIRVMPSLGSTGGIKAVAAGVLDIGLSSRPLTEAEQSQGLSAREICRNPFVFATSVKTPVSNLTFADLAAIYSGERKTWNNGTPIRPVLRPLRDTDTALVKAMSSEIAQAVMAAHERQGANVALTDTDAADVIERVPGAIGTTSIALITSEKRKLKPIALNGVLPSLQALADGSYPYHKVLHIVTRADASPLTQQFVQFIASPAGTRILRANGNLVTARQQ